MSRIYPVEVDHYGAGVPPARLGTAQQEEHNPGVPCLLHSIPGTFSVQDPPHSHPSGFYCRLGGQEVKYGACGMGLHLMVSTLLTSVWGEDQPYTLPGLSVPALATNRNDS